ncbi:MAG: hypothetical protein ACREUU_15905, partial [Gammaproteobacteria bacterium]
MPTPKNKKVKSIPATAFHGKAEDGTHVVGIGNLRVILFQEGDLWFAQGLEIDYASQGDSLEDVKKQFEDGLGATIEEHLRVYGNIDKILNVAPSEVWKEMLVVEAAGVERRALGNGKAGGENGGSHNPGVHGPLLVQLLFPCRDYFFISAASRRLCDHQRSPPRSAPEGRLAIAQRFSAGDRS